MKWPYWEGGDRNVIGLGKLFLRAYFAIGGEGTRLFSGQTDTV